MAFVGRRIKSTVDLVIEIWRNGRSPTDSMKDKMSRGTAGEIVKREEYWAKFCLVCDHWDCFVYFIIAA
jgi:hypothetical protein